ncbi:MAG: FAD-dependent monooxygenase [Dongiaceae bacterium]
MSASGKAPVCVLGGGPAGAVAAARLAELGHEVILLHAARRQRHARAESLAPSVPPLLASVGLEEAAHAATIPGSGRSLVLWEGEEERRDGSPTIDRDRFDQALRAAARDAGAVVVAPARGRAIRRHDGRGWQVELRRPRSRALLETGFLVDARGRRPGIGAVAAPPTVALTGHWPREEALGPETRIEALEEGWLWGTVRADGGCSTTAFLDPARVAGLPTAARCRLLRRLLAASRLLSGIADLAAEPALEMRDATPRLAADLAGPDFIRVGEAALASDPLCAQGVRAAVQSALQAAAVIHTILSRPADAGLAVGFYGERQRRSASLGRGNAARLYAAAAQRHGTGFWSCRAAGAEPTAAPPAAPRVPLRIAPAPALRILEVPVIQGGCWIERARAVSHPALPEPVFCLGSTPLAPLLDAVRHGLGTERLLDLWSQRVSPAIARQILHWMLGSGLLVAAPAA